MQKCWSKSCPISTNLRMSTRVSPIILILFAISDTSVKNNIITSALIFEENIISLQKLSTNAMNVSSTKAELFAIRCSISQVIQIQGII